MKLNSLMPRGTLIIRTDATSSIGIGHFMRSIALAQEWQDRGGHVVFVSNCQEKALIKRITEIEGFTLRLLPSSISTQKDLTLTENIINEYPCHDWVVLDGYQFDPAYQNLIKEHTKRVLVVDDYNHHTVYHCDILLNQNHHSGSINYKCDKSTILLLGNRYVMLRREFRNEKSKNKNITVKAKNILITMGGSDPENLSIKAFQALRIIDNPHIITKVIIGPTNPFQKKIIQEAGQTIEVLSNVTDMPKLISWADIVISAAGSTCWEIAYLGIPAILIIVADNQVSIAKGLDAAGAAINYGDHTKLDQNHLANIISDLIEDRDKREAMSHNGSCLIDGYGAERIINEMDHYH